MSDGIRSAVPCTRLNTPPSAPASDLLSSVLPRPGAPCSSTWPRATTAMASARITGSMPITTAPRSCCSFRSNDSSAFIVRESPLVALFSSAARERARSDCAAPRDRCGAARRRGDAAPAADPDPRPRPPHGPRSQSHTGAPSGGRPSRLRISLKKFANSRWPAAAGRSTRAMKPPVARTKLVTSSGFQLRGCAAQPPRPEHEHQPQPQQPQQRAMQARIAEELVGIVERHQPLVRVVDDHTPLLRRATSARCWRASCALSCSPRTLLVKMLP